MKKQTVVFALSLLMLVGAGTAIADDDFVYGRQLMTQQELAEHQAKMRSFKTEPEREQYRIEHHQRMQERAREQGVTLPEDPRQRPRDGRGMGQGPRDGSGMGPDQRDRKGMGMGRP